MTTEHTDISRYSVYRSDGVWYYRASSIGGCINELVLIRKGELGEDKSPYIQQVLDAGNEYEGPVRVQVAQMMDMTIVSDHEAAKLWIDDENCVVGNTDGVMQGEIEGAIGEAGVEIKTLGEDSFNTFVRYGLERFPEYQWQLSVYMHATGLPFLYGAAPRMRDKDDDGNWRFWVEPEKVHMLGLITEPPIPLSRIKRKIRRIGTLSELEMADLPLCEKAKFCSMSRFHDLIGGNIDAEEGEEIGPDDDLYDLIVRRVELKGQEDQIAAERKEIDAQLKTLMEGPARIEGLGRLVPILSPGRMTYDTKQMALDFGEDIEKYKKVGSPFSQLRWYGEKT